MKTYAKDFVKEDPKYTYYCSLGDYLAGKILCKIIENHPKRKIIFRIIHKFYCETKEISERIPDKKLLIKVLYLYLEDFISRSKNNLEKDYETFFKCVCRSWVRDLIRKKYSN